MEHMKTNKTRIILFVIIKKLLMDSKRKFKVSQSDEKSNSMDEGDEKSKEIW